MKLVSLNIWDAQIFDPLMKFFENNQDVDIFCLQEVFNGDVSECIRGAKRANGYSEVSKRLPKHKGFFANTENLDDVPKRGLSIPYGLAIFIKNEIDVLSHHHENVFSGGIFSNEDPKTHKRIVQTICILKDNQPLAVSNVHGLWNGKGKTDTPERIEQSQNIKKHINTFKHPVMLVGDFNLLPETESLAIVSEGMRNLIKENNIKSTRTSLYTKHEKPVLFADYVFTSPDILINNFEVLKDEVSDHSPLLVEF